MPVQKILFFGKALGVPTWHGGPSQDLLGSRRTPEASPKTPRGASRAPKSIQKPIRKPKNAIFSKHHFYRPCRCCRGFWPSGNVGKSSIWSPQDKHLTNLKKNIARISILDDFLATFGTPKGSKNRLFRSSRNDWIAEAIETTAPQASSRGRSP